MKEYDMYGNLVVDDNEYSSYYEEDNNMTNLIELRKSLDVTKRDIARFCDVSDTAVAKYEKGIIGSKKLDLLYNEDLIVYLHNEKYKKTYELKKQVAECRHLITLQDGTVKRIDEVL